MSPTYYENKKAKKVKFTIFIFSCFFFRSAQGQLASPLPLHERRGGATGEFKKWNVRIHSFSRKNDREVKFFPDSSPAGQYGCPGRRGGPLRDRGGDLVPGLFSWVRWCHFSDSPANLPSSGRGGLADPESIWKIMKNVEKSKIYIFVFLFLIAS